MYMNKVRQTEKRKLKVLPILLSVHCHSEVQAQATTLASLSISKVGSIHHGLNQVGSIPHGLSPPGLNPPGLNPPGLSPPVTFNIDIPLVRGSKVILFFVGELKE